MIRLAKHRAYKTRCPASFKQNPVHSAFLWLLRRRGPGRRLRFRLFSCCMVRAWMRNNNSLGPRSFTPPLAMSRTPPSGCTVHLDFTGARQHVRGLSDGADKLGNGRINIHLDSVVLEHRQERDLCADERLFCRIGWISPGDLPTNGNHRLLPGTRHDLWRRQNVSPFLIVVSFPSIAATLSPDIVSRSFQPARLLPSDRAWRPPAPQSRVHSGITSCSAAFSLSACRRKRKSNNHTTPTT